MRAIGEITWKMSADRKFRAVEMLYPIKGHWYLDNINDIPANVPSYGLFEFEEADQFCKWIEPNKT